MTCDVLIACLLNPDRNIIRFLPCTVTTKIVRVPTYTTYQCFGPGFTESRSGSSILGWIPYPSGSGSKVFFDQKLKKVYCLKKCDIFFNQKLQFTYSLASIKDVKARREALALKRKHPALLNMKFLNFFCFSGSFLPSWIRIRIPNQDQDPLTWLKPNPIWIRIWNTATYYPLQNIHIHCISPPGTGIGFSGRTTKFISPLLLLLLDPGSEIRDKHPGSATLGFNIGVLLVVCFSFCFFLYQYLAECTMKIGVLT